MKNSLVKKILISLGLIVLLVIIDQWSKLLAVDRLMGDKPFVVIDNLLTFEYVENPGAAFSSFLNQKVFLCVITVIALVIFSYYLIKCNNKYSYIGLILAMGCAFGNFIDRLRLSYVIDFISFDFFSPVFNVADCFLTVGVAILMIVMLKDTAQSLKEGGE